MQNPRQVAHNFRASFFRHPQVEGRAIGVRFFFFLRQLSKKCKSFTRTRSRTHPLATLTYYRQPPCAKWIFNNQAALWFCWFVFAPLLSTHTLCGRQTEQCKKSKSSIDSDVTIAPKSGLTIIARVLQKLLVAIDKTNWQRQQR